MRILQVGPIPPEAGGTTTGGVATHVWELAEHLSEKGHSVAILADNFPSPVDKPVFKQKVMVYGLSRELNLGELLKILNLSWLKKVINLKEHFGELIRLGGISSNLLFYEHVITDFKPDVIHVHTMENRFPFVYFSARNKIPIVTTLHSFSSIKFLKPSLAGKYRRLIEKNLKLAKNLIIVSHFIQGELKEFFGDFQGKSWAIYYPMDNSKYYPILKEEAKRKVGISLDTPTVLFVGNLIKRKGEYILVKAAKILKNRGHKIKIIIVGDGPERKGIEKFVEENELKNTVTLVGAKYYPELLYYYNAADLFVMPSFGEGFGIVYLEAMLCGIPVISTKGIADETIPSKDYGFLVSPDNANVLAGAIERGLKKKWEKKRIVKYARSFDWDKRIGEFEKVYEEISR